CDQGDEIEIKIAEGETGSVDTSPSAIDMYFTVEGWTEHGGSAVGFDLAENDKGGLVGPLDGITGSCTASDNICTGSYTPNVSTGANLDTASAPGALRYRKINDEVCIRGRLTADVTTADTQFDFSVSLPIASDFTSVDEDAQGSLTTAVPTCNA